MNEPTAHLGVGDRLTEDPAPELIHAAYALEVSDGPLLYRGMSLADMAQALMLVEIDLIPEAAANELLAALLALHRIPGTDFPFDPAHGDAYTNRELRLRQKAPQGAGWLQAGRPRREVSTLAFLLVVRERLLTLIDATLGLMRAMLDLAEANLDTLMPDYTYLQTAHPTTLAHYLLTFVQPLTRDLARLKAAFGRVNLSPAGAGSTNGSRLPLNRERLAELLGFEGLVWHTRDAMWQPDLPVEVMSTLVALLVNLDRCAEDLQIWATAEFNFIELADRHSRISVIMPHKKNPYSLAFVRGMARQMIGQASSVAALGATPSGQVDNRTFIYGPVPRALAQAEQTVRLLTGVVGGLTVNRAVLARRVQSGFGGATDLVDVISQTCRLDTYTAHRIVGQAVRIALKTGDTLTPSILDRVADKVVGRPLGLTAETINQAIDPAAIVATRIGPGGAAPSAVQAMIESFRDVLAEATQWQQTLSHQTATVETRLLQMAQDLIGDEAG